MSISDLQYSALFNAHLQERKARRKLFKVMRDVLTPGSTIEWRRAGRSHSGVVVSIAEKVPVVAARVRGRSSLANVHISEVLDAFPVEQVTK